MVVDPKVVGGGAAVVAIGGGSGYAISQVVDSSKESNNNLSSSQPTTANPQPNKGAISPNHKEANKTVLGNAGFEITENTETAGDCKTKLEAKTLSSEDDFKQAVIACVKGKKFANKAEKLGLDILKTGNDSERNSSWETYKSSVKIIVTSIESKNNWNDAKSEIIKFCTENTSGQGNKEINQNSQDSDWKNFLKVCAKDKGIVTVANIEKNNFWTNKPTSSVQ